MKKPERIDLNKKLYVVNTNHGRGMLHINDGRCCHVKGKPKGDYEDFDTELSAMKAFHHNLKKCKICFADDLK